ncbi:MAG: TolC family protein [Candidatus Sericytochromatia bacterium]|nr:TolC family protein [Candidatus Sericytochromatia bacterium]
MSKNRYILLASFLFMSLFPLPGSPLAQPLAQAERLLSPSQAVLRTWRNHSTLRQLRREYARAQARLLQVGLWSNPELGLTAEDFAGSAALTDDRFTQFTLEWVQTLPLGDKLSQAKHLAELETELLNWEYRIQQRRLAGDVYLAYGRLRYFLARISLADDLLSNARETLALIEIRVNTGKQSPLGALQARQQVLMLEAEGQEMAAQKRVSDLELAALWGESQLKDLPDVSAYTAPQRLSELMFYQQRLSQHPQVLRWLLENQIRQVSLTNAQAQTAPDLTASGGLRYHPPGDWGVVASIGLPLAMFNRNQGQIEDARLRQNSLSAEREQELAKLNAELSRNYEVYTSAYQRWQLYQQQLQLSQEAYRIALIAFDAGKTSYLDVLQSQQGYFTARRSLLETQYVLEQALITLRGLTNDVEPIKDLPITEPEGPQP